jgi:protein-tyrosine-phosphatase
MATYVGDLSVEVTSAGILDLIGVPSPPETLQAARVINLDLGNHRSAYISSAGLPESDLVVGFERRHVAAAVVEGGAATARAFTLVELLAIIDDIEMPSGLAPLERATEVVARAHELRRSTGRFVPGEETPDPIGKPLAAHRQMAEEISEMCRRLAAALFGGLGPASRDATGS